MTDWYLWFGLIATNIALIIIFIVMLKNLIRIHERLEKLEKSVLSKR